MTGDTLRVFAELSQAGGRGSSQPGGAKRAFAGLFAATASLTGAAMTTRTVSKAVAVPDNCRSACGRRLGTSCSAGCREGREFRNGFRTGGPERKKARRSIDIGRVYALPPRLRIPVQTPPEVLSGENSESVADVYLQPVQEHGIGAE